MKRRVQIEIIQGDITSLSVEAIVNAANKTLLGGGGVDGAIHRAAGPELLDACRRIPEVRSGVRCPIGGARITPGFRLAARYVIHTVGPVWRGGGHGEEELLAACYRSALRLAIEHDITSVAFPAISCGAYGYPIAGAARVAASTIRGVLSSGRRLERVVLAAFSEEIAHALREAKMRADPNRSRK
jgi:O-acetyl-ADP-ribose deacetylase (regulator of RNase III)